MSYNQLNVFIGFVSFGGRVHCTIRHNHIALSVIKTDLKMIMPHLLYKSGLTPRTVGYNLQQVQYSVWTRLNGHF
jgi:hypothetical protein